MELQPTEEPRSGVSSPEAQQTDNRAWRIYRPVTFVPLSHLRGFYCFTASSAPQRS